MGGFNTRSTNIMLTLTNKTLKERAELKSAEIVKLPPLGIFTEAAFGLTLEIQAVNKIEGGIEMLARAWKGTKQLGFGKDGSVEIERFRIFNPPIMVPDGTKREEVDQLTGKVHLRDNFKEDPREATLQTLAHIVSIVGKDGSNIVVGKVGNTTSTFYPSSDTSIYALDPTWAGARGALTGTLRAGAISYLQESDAGVNYVIERYFATLDTAAIPDTDAISSATLSVYVVGLPGTPERTIRAYDSTHSDTVVADDFDLRGSNLWSSNSIVRTTATLNAYNDLTFNATGIAGINKTGNTKLSIVGNLDAANTDPGDEVDDPCISFSNSTEAGTAQDPKLVVVHAAAGSTRKLTLLGVG